LTPPIFFTRLFDNRVEEAYDSFVGKVCAKDLLSTSVRLYCLVRSVLTYSLVVYNVLYSSRFIFIWPSSSLIFSFSY